MKHLICNKTKELLRFMVYILLPLTGGGWVGVSCSDYDDYNTVPGVFGGDQTGANNTLWENISNDQQLTRFADLARKCSFSEVLNSPRFYTVWAPVNDAISDAEYNRLMASDSATVLKHCCARQHHYCVAQHEAPSLHSVLIRRLQL